MYECFLVLVLLAAMSLVSWWSVSSGNGSSVAGRTDTVYKDRHTCGGSVLVWVLTFKHLFIFNKYYYQLVIATYLVVATQQRLDILIIIATWIHLDTATTHTEF